MVSYKIARLLKESGWTKKTVQTFPLETPGVWEFKHFFYAPSLEELLEELPDGVSITPVRKEFGVWCVSGMFFEHHGKQQCFSDNNPCDAAARLWIELKGVRSVKQCDECTNEDRVLIWKHKNLFKFCPYCGESLKKGVNNETKPV